MIATLTILLNISLNPMQLFFHSGTGGSSHKTQTVVLFQKTKNNIKLAQLERDCWSGTTSRTSRYS